jgi:hypothetical protein
VLLYLQVGGPQKLLGIFRRVEGVQVVQGFPSADKAVQGQEWCTLSRESWSATHRMGSPDWES